MGTFVFPCLLRCIGSVPQTGAVSLWAFWLFIMPAGVSFAIDAINGVDSTIGGLRVSPYLMLVTVALSRIWLWCFDLAECQIMQEWVEENERGTMNSVQTAMYQVFWVLLSVQGMALSDPSDFFVLAILSVATVFCAALIFTAWAASPSAQAAAPMKSGGTGAGSRSASEAGSMGSSVQLQGSLNSLVAAVSKLSADLERMDSKLDQRLSRLEQHAAAAGPAAGGGLGAGPPVGK